MINTVLSQEYIVTYIIFITILVCIQKMNVSSIFTLKRLAGNNLGFAFCGKDKDWFMFVVAELSDKNKNITGGVC
ncbi:MAG TPA: hypothetical protein PL190_08085, partial [Caldisericia bacterium]|nr:hypothetical protein [Caldisericia bacterium]